jgi:FAD synthase
MTPDAAFGFERRGTPAALASLGASDGFEVVVVPPFTIDGEEVRSSTIRAAVTAGDLATASALLGRPVTVSGFAGDPSGGACPIDFELPMALPPAGDYAAEVDGVPLTLRLADGEASLLGPVANRRVTIALRA